MECGGDSDLSSSDPSRNNKLVFRLSRSAILIAAKTKLCESMSFAPPLRMQFNLNLIHCHRGNRRGICPPVNN